MLKIFKMINVKIRILRGLLEEAINNIDAGNSNHTEEEFNEIIDDLTKLNRGMYHTKANGIVCRGEVFTVEDAKAIYDKHVRNINREITYWDVYVAVNAQYHDYVRLYQDWFPNLTEEQLDEKVIYSAINFWFKDEDAGTGKVWNYFKEI